MMRLSKEIEPYIVANVIFVVLLVLCLIITPVHVG